MMSAGKFYARAMGIWSTLLAAQGFIYDGPAGLIGFKPVWKPEDHESLFTAAEGWGLFTQHQAPSGQTEQIAVRYGRLALKSMIFEVGPEPCPQRSLSAPAKTVPSSFEAKDGTVKITLASELAIGEGQAVDVLLK